MYSKFGSYIIISLSLLGAISGLYSCNKKNDSPMIVCTMTPGGIVSLSSGGILKNIDPANGIYLISPEDSGSVPLHLTKDFYSANSPAISYDGKNMLFSGRENITDTWGIWEMDLKKKKARRLTSAEDNCTDPVYLPGERYAFIMHLQNDSLRARQAIFTCNLSSAEPDRITFDPASYTELSVLKDGRLLTTRRQVFPDSGRQLMIVMRPDGTKAEMFYMPAEGSGVASTTVETAAGNILFIESEVGTLPGSMTSIKYSRPLNSKGGILEEFNGKVTAFSISGTDKLLLACVDDRSGGFTITEYDQSGSSSGKIILKGKKFVITDIAVAEPYQRPRKLPSEVDKGVKSGLVLCQNINLTGLQSPEDMNFASGASKAEIMGLEKTLGIVDVEEDGSFYLKVKADIPFRIRTLDNNGNVINGPGTWLYVRPNERRGCVGCHEDQEIVPANRIALAVKKHPVTIPVLISRIKEKEVELE